MAATYELLFTGRCTEVMEVSVPLKSATVAIVSETETQVGKTTSGESNSAIQ